MRGIVTSLLVICMAGNCAHAAELKLVAGDLPPYAYKSAEGEGGPVYEVALELAKRVGQSTQVEFLPYARAQSEAASNDNVGIFPIARVPEREGKYTWLVEVVRDPYVFVTMKNSDVDISTVEATKRLRIGALRGTLAEVLLKKMGFEILELTNSDQFTLEKLAAGRIDAWVVPPSSIVKYSALTGIGRDQLRTGAELMMLHEYVAASKSLDAATAEKWRAAFDDMKQDGSYAAIVTKYGFEPLK